jgi:methyl-accepting chemotaxis protein
MKINGFSHIRKWLLLYLAMVLLTTMVIYLSIFVEITGALSAANISGVAQETMGSERTAPLPIAGLKLRLLLILTGGFIICLLLGFVWVGFCTRRIGQPVRIIATAMSKLTRGQLNETVTVGTSDEFEQIGASINELAANLQELLLYIWKQTGQCHALLDHIHNNPDFRQDKRLTLESLGYLKQLYEAIDDLREMAKAYVFYDVSIEGTNTHAINEPGDGATANSIPEEVHNYRL